MVAGPVNGVVWLLWMTTLAKTPSQGDNGSTHKLMDPLKSTSMVYMACS